MQKNEFAAADTELKTWRADLCPYARCGNLNLPAGTVIVSVLIFGDAAISAMDMQTRKLHQVRPGTKLDVKLNIGSEAGVSGGSIVITYVLPLFDPS